MIASADLGGIAAIVAAVAWLILALFLSLMLVNVFRLLESTKTTLDGVRDETVPLLGEVRVTVTSVNKDLERVDGMLDSAGKIVKTVERLSTLIENTIQTPLIKVAGASAGMARAYKRFKEKR
jgi:uncharacterized protein YoxC